ncbi:MAG: hypothetical protein QM820_13845 [Minicystis sp.]
MRKAAVSLSFVSAFATIALSASASAADVCLRIDESRDTLSAQERAAAQAIFAQAVESAGDQLSGNACSRTYVLSHRKTGNVINIRITGPGGSREASCGKIEELRRVYRRMLISLQKGVPMERASVPDALSSPEREAADKIYYTRLGGSALPSAGMQGGPDLGLGMRLELDRIGIDASMSFGVAQSGPKKEVTGVHGSIIKLTAQYYFMSQSDSTPYLGGGLSWGGRKQELDNLNYSATGLQAELIAGYELLRSSTIRIFLQADATLPLYMAKAGAHETPTLHGKARAPATPQISERYLPTLGLSLGIGWGRSHVLGLQQTK